MAHVVRTDTRSYAGIVEISYQDLVYFSIMYIFGKRYGYVHTCMYNTSRLKVLKPSRFPDLGIEKTQWAGPAIVQRLLIGKR